MSEEYWRFLNRLLTALMLVVAMIACQQMPKINNSDSVESESKLENLNDRNFNRDKRLNNNKIYRP